ncbi:MAG: hypothetical protein WB992_02740, partial [Bryobacteraceae bacterium]
AWLGRIPAKGLSIAVMCNAASANAGGFAYQIARLYLGLSKPEPPVPPNNVTPGLYRGAHDHSTLKVEYTNGKFTFDGYPVEAKVRFEDDKMFASNPVYGEEIFDRVEPWTPANLSAFAGVYSSDEAETVLTVVVEDGKLAIHRHPNSSLPLEPTYADAFKCSLGGVRFLRDATGKIVALILSGPRVWDLRFVRERSSGAEALRPW